MNRATPWRRGEVQNIVDACTGRKSSAKSEAQLAAEAKRARKAAKVKQG